MPRRARPAIRDRLEAELSPAWRAALAEAVEVCVLGANWQAAEALQVAVTHVAALQLAVRLAADGNLSEDVALEQACARLGIPADTIRTRHRRWYCDTRSHVEPAASPEPVPISGNLQPEAAA